MHAIALAAALLAAPLSFAGTVYTGAGLPGAILGYAQPLSDSVGLRADVATLGHYRTMWRKPQVTYDAQLQARRLGLFSDWFAYQGLRLTGGVTLNDVRLDMVGRSTGSTLVVGGYTYATGPDDRLDVTVRFPRVMPYAGIGYGFQPTAGKGWGVAFDLGVAWGRPRISAAASGPLLANTLAQDAVDREVASVSDDLGWLKGIPQASVSLTYRF